MHENVEARNTEGHANWYYSIRQKGKHKKQASKQLTTINENMANMMVRWWLVQNTLPSISTLDDYKYNTHKSYDCTNNMIKFDFHTWYL